MSEQPLIPLIVEGTVYVPDDNGGDVIAWLAEDDLP